MMQSMPMPGGQKMKVYSREELMAKTMKGMKGPGEGGDDDDDEEEEEEEEEEIVRLPFSSTFFKWKHVFGCLCVRSDED